MLSTIYDKIFSSLFSKLTPFQLLLTSILAFILGFLPGFSYAPLIFLVVISLVVILRINIGVFVILFGIAKLLSFTMQSISFGIGRTLLDGFAQPLFKILVNTPIVAYAGFDYYLVTGGFILAIIIGLIVGIFLSKIFKTLVNKMSKIQTGTALYNKITKNFFVKVTSFIFMGKSVSKIDWVAMQKRSMIQPFRIVGVILVALLVTAIAYSPKLLETAMVSNIIKQQLSKANGSTVDFESIQLDLSDAKLEINGLGVSNPLDLNRNRFYAKTMSASLDLTGIMTKQLVLNDVVINGVSLDMKRSSKGKLYRSSLSMTKSKDTTSMLDNINDVSKNASSFNKLNIEKYKNHAETAQKIATNAKKIVETLSDFNGLSFDTINNEKRPTSDIVNEAKVYGYANVRAENLQTEKPMLTILNLIVKDYEDFGGKYNIIATNISTNPTLLNKSTTIEVKSVDNDDLNINILMSNNANTQNNLNFDVKNLGKNFVEGLNVGGVVLNASSANISGNGQWNFIGPENANFNLPITIELKDVSASFNGIKQKVGKMTLKGVLSGDINNPDLNMDATSLDKMFDVNEVAGNLLNKAGIQGNTKDILKNTKINGKTINDMNADDIRNVASSFGIKF